MQAERENVYEVMSTEHELKCLLTEEEYGQLLALLEPLPYLREHQRNYYYDTRLGKLRRDNITMRIREKNGKLKGTIKHHLVEKHCSVEKSFRVDSIPDILAYEEDLVYLFGDLMTCRTTFFLSDNVKIMLDRNEYQHCVDYELELEYPAEFFEGAEGIMFFLKKIIQIDRRDAPSSKSERFFQKKEKQYQTPTLNVRVER